MEEQPKRVVSALLMCRFPCGVVGRKELQRLCMCFVGLLHEGDELLEVNSIELRGRSLDEVSELLVST